MLIAQITDPHVTETGAGPAGVDGGASLARAIAAVGTMNPRPEGIALSGDLVERGTAEEYSRLSSLLRDSAVPVWPMPGNHDERASFVRTFPAFAPEDGSEHIRYTVDAGSVRLVMLDSLVPGRAGGALGGVQLDWLERTLAAAAARPTIIFVHHPPPSTGLAHIDRSALADADALAAVVARHACVVRISCGHLHVALALDWAGKTLTVCPSVAHRFALDLSEDGRITPLGGPPAFQLHRWYAGALHTYTVTLNEEGSP